MELGKKKKYPDLFKWAYATGKEKILLSAEERKQIPRQTISDWRALSEQKLNKLETAMDLQDDLKRMLTRQEQEQKIRQRLFISASRFQLQLIEHIGKKNYHKLLAKDKRGFLDLIHTYSQWIPFTQVLRMFQMSTGTYRNWISQCSYRCEASLLQLCARRHPFQITKKEYEIIEAALQDPFYAYWPKSAIHSHLLKKNVLSISRSTFYKHARFIEPNSEKRFYKKPNYVSLRADYVNEIWHMDISQFRTKDGKKYYIYAIIDNFSRKILAWNCLEYISKEEIGVIIARSLENLTGIHIRLVSDAGTENVNHYIQHLLHQFYESYETRFQHEIALRTIRQSNSMIERFFRIMKSQNLYHNIPNSYPELYMRLEGFIGEYNGIRPHYALSHQTPSECYSGQLALDFYQSLNKARSNRYRLNKKCSCQVCTCSITLVPEEFKTQNHERMRSAFA